MIKSIFIFITILLITKTLLVIGKHQRDAAEDEATAILEQAFQEAGIQLTDYKKPEKQSIFSRGRFRLPSFNSVKSRLLFAKKLPFLSKTNEDSKKSENDVYQQSSSMLFPAMNSLFPPVWQPTFDKGIPIPILPNGPIGMMSPPIGNVPFSPVLNAQFIPPTSSNQIQPSNDQSSSQSSQSTITKVEENLTTSTTNSASNKFSPILNRYGYSNNEIGFVPISVNHKKSRSNSKIAYNDNQSPLKTILDYNNFDNLSKKSIGSIYSDDFLKNIYNDNKAKRPNSSASIDCSNKDLGWCDYSEHYPDLFARRLAKGCSDILKRMYVEVPENLADFDNFVPFAPKNDSNKNDYEYDISRHTWSWAGYRSKEATLCDSDKQFIRPGLAHDINGRWFLILQTSLYNQRVAVDICRSPGDHCNHVSKCDKRARCVQKFSTQLLISVNLDKEEECPQMKLYRFPSGCVCDSANFQ